MTEGYVCTLLSVFQTMVRNAVSILLVVEISGVSGILCALFRPCLLRFVLVHTTVCLFARASVASVNLSA